ncbi:churchill-like protein [Piromyces finnis]|uniref:Protein Churchill n=1 Tax=Piromyces finnis TaxID=1754191 RepID=A0A1Y1VKH3_9FUNG|nr:churchill-like protein [Piromyces finnis]|eukprot:ORX57878.1 churchill-like protein [Piromyces finnis]
MCQECVIEVSPDRGNITVESGFYPLNMKKCKNCQTFSTPKTTDYVNDETEDSTSITITYNHTCSKCNHLIASHEYTYQLNDGYHEYTMNCDLCGMGEANVSVLPVDPKKILESYS